MAGKAGKGSGRKPRRKHKASVRRRRITFGGVTARMIMAVLAGLMFLSFLSVVANPAKAWIVAVFGLMFLPLFFANLFLFLWAVKRRSRSFVIPLAALLPSVFFIGGYFRFPPLKHDRTEESDATIKIISYNVGRFLQGHGAAGDMSACSDSVRTFLASQDADIICLQEFYTTDPGDVKKILSEWLPGYRSEYYFYTGRHGYYGNVTFSRMKAGGKGVIHFDGSANLAIYTDYVADGEAFRVYNCHFESYNISSSGLLRSIRRKDRARLKETEVKMRRGLAQRPRQVNQVLEHIAESPEEAFVCGDFNDTPMSYTYYKLSRGREDTFREAGAWFGSSFSFMWPLLRIDYILYPEQFSALSHRTPHERFSDHYPVIAEISLDRDEG